MRHTVFSLILGISAAFSAPLSASTITVPFGSPLITFNSISDGCGFTNQPPCGGVAWTIGDVTFSAAVDGANNAWGLRDFAIGLGRSLVDNVGFGVQSFWTISFGSLYDRLGLNVVTPGSYTVSFLRDGTVLGSTSFSIGSLTAARFAGWEDPRGINVIRIEETSPNTAVTGIDNIRVGDVVTPSVVPLPAAALLLLGGLGALGLVRRRQAKTRAV